jgi:hypothetical protein
VRVPTCAALFAALAGHVLIDILGHHVLICGKYDATTHRSRDLVAIDGLALARVREGRGRDGTAQRTRAA